MFRISIAATFLAFSLCLSAAAQISIIEQANISFPLEAELKGVEGCCKVGFELQPDGSKRIDDTYCTSPVFEQSAIDVVTRSRFAGPANAKARIPIKFAFADSTSGSCAAPDTWNSFVEDSAKAFPWEAADFDSDHDYQVARAKGIAGIRVNLNYDGNCGFETLLQPADIRALDAINSLATLRTSETSLIARQSWLDCRVRTLDNYEAESRETAARYAQTAPTDFRFWVAQYMASNVTRERGKLDQEATKIARFEVALDAALSRAEDIAYIRAERRRTARQNKQRDRSKADAFFASRGPGQYEACLASAYTYSSRQNCLTDWIGGSSYWVEQPILNRTVPDRRYPAREEQSTSAPISKPRQTEPICPAGYSCNCGPEPVPYRKGDGACR